MISIFLICSFPLEISANTFDKIKNAKVYEQIEKTTSFLIQAWEANEGITSNPPQVISISANRIVYGGCGSYLSGEEVGGSSYCGSTNTIFLVPSQLKGFEEEFGPSAVAYVVAHEFAHAVQNAYGIRLPVPNHELQADCLAGVFIKEGSEELGITREDTIAMAKVAYSIGDDTHGTGEQRAYALTTGMGVIDGSCKAEQIKLLAEGKLDTSNFSNTRSASKNVNLKITPYPQTIISSLGL
ncbi:neutral zinc metallopeptidase [Prochlorococcus marinus]|nr:neutral zinc metallopeptidase [Prochlorococcus marinus]KGG14397.1 hypothetical protein EV05_0004 [Prochlorococcus sp. MIT 0601]